MRDEIGLDEQDAARAARLPAVAVHRPGSRSELARRFAYVCVETPEAAGAAQDGAHRSPARRPRVAGVRTAATAGPTCSASPTPGCSPTSRTEIGRRTRAPRRGGRRRSRRPSRRLDWLDAGRAAYQAVTELSWDQVDVGAVRGGTRPLGLGHRRGHRRQSRDRPSCRTRSTTRSRKVADRTRGRRPGRRSAFEDARRAVERDRRRGRPGPAWRSTKAEASGFDLRADQPRIPRRRCSGRRHWWRGWPSRGRARRVRCRLSSRAAERLSVDRRGRDRVTIGRRGRSCSETFETFLERWPNPNLHTDPDASYARLRPSPRRPADQRPARARDRVARQPAQTVRQRPDRPRLRPSSRAVREIRDRIDPINQILAELPFADDDHRLRIDTAGGPVRGTSAASARSCAPCAT